MKRVVRLRDAFVGAAGRGIDLRRAPHLQRLVWAFPIKFLYEGVEFPLLLQQVGASGACGFLLQRQMHPFMAAVLLRMTGPYALNRGNEPEPPHRKLRELKEPMRRSEWNTIIGTDGPR